MLLKGCVECCCHLRVRNIQGEEMIRKVLGKGLRLMSKARRFYRPRILLYTDSRGTNIPGHNNYIHYGARLEKQFAVDAWYCPKKWTTTIDFLSHIEAYRPDRYDCIILHTGIVDASPRPKQMLLNIIYPEKKTMLDSVFGERVLADYYSTDLQCEYEGDQTLNLYTIDMAKEALLPRLGSIPNLLWIGANRFVPGWRGNYWKDRPENIGIVENYAQVFEQRLTNVISLLNWDYDAVRKRTFDNVHPNQIGSDLIYEEVIARLAGIGIS